MSINIGPPASDDLRPRITVVGVGGAGGNAIANMIDAEVEGVEFIAANTDAQALNASAAEKRIQLGPDITGGLGAGARPEVGKAAAEETVSEIEEALQGVNMCFIAAGMGGGTGTGAAPVIAEAARRQGVLTVGVVTKPFLFEGTRRMRAAEAGIEELQEHVDTLIVIPNQNLFLVAKAETTFKEAFELADEVLQQGVRSITDLMVMPGLINLDFADVRSVMSEMGKAMMGTGEGSGENRALEAAERAIANPLLDGVSMQGARGVIISIIGGEDMKLLEVDEAANHIRELVDDDANIIWGSAFNPDLTGTIRVSVVATGIEEGAEATETRGSRLSLGESRAPRRPVLDLPAEGMAGDGEASGGNGAALAAASLGGAVVSEEISVLDAEIEGGEYAEAGDDDWDQSNADQSNSDQSAASRSSIAHNSFTPSEPDRSYASASNSDQAAANAAGDNDSDNPLPDDGWDTPAGKANAADRRFDAPEAAAGSASDSASSVADDADELVLGEDLTTEVEINTSGQQDEVPAAGGRRRGLVMGGRSDSGSASDGDSSGDAPESGSETASSGGRSSGSTLFERMANLSRGNPAHDHDDDDEDEESAEGGARAALNIPRFLNRQNNQ